MTSGKTRILIVITNSDLAGAPLHVASLINASSSRVDFAICFGGNGEFLEKIDQPQTVSLFHAADMQSSLSLRKDLPSFNRICEAVHEFKPDLIHVHSAKASILGRMAAIRFGIPSVYTVHGWSWRGKSSLFALLYWGIEFFFARASRRTRYIYVSEDTAQTARRLLFIPERNGSFIPNGVRCPTSASTEPKACPPEILMVARVCEAKDHKTLLDSFERLDPPSRLVFVGQGTDSDEFIELARRTLKQRFSDAVFIGPTPHVDKFYQRASVFALSSHYEALPMSIIEAMSHALPIVSTDVGGVRTLVENDINGCLVAPGSPTCFAEALQDVLRPERLAVLGQASHEKFLNKFSAETFSNRTLEVYKKALAY